MAQLSEYCEDLKTTDELDSLTQLTARYLGLFMPSAVCALYRHDVEADLLVCAGVGGDDTRALRNLTIRRGDKISGWAAANDTTIANSDACLDLGRLAEDFSPRLRSALSTPMKQGDRLVGVLTVYATEVHPFGDDHKYLAERVAELLTPRFSVLMDRPVTTSRTLDRTPVSAER